MLVNKDNKLLEEYKDKTPYRYNTTIKPKGRLF